MILDEELTVLKPNASASPRFLARKSKIHYRYVIDLLSYMVYESTLDARYIIFCTNEDPELVHAFEFDSMGDVKNFIKTQQFSCPDCGYKLNTQDIRVAFVKKESQLKKLEV